MPYCSPHFKSDTLHIPSLSCPLLYSIFFSSNSISFDHIKSYSVPIDLTSSYHSYFIFHFIASYDILRYHIISHPSLFTLSSPLLSPLLSSPYLHTFISPPLSSPLLTLSPLLELSSSPLPSPLLSSPLLSSPYLLNPLSEIRRDLE